MYTLPLSNVDKITFEKKKLGLQPVFYRGTFEVDEPADTFLNPTGLKHGIVFLNGFNVGRYWTIGPQLTLYVPAPILKKGTNELIIFEADDVADIDLRVAQDAGDAGVPGGKLAAEGAGLFPPAVGEGDVGDAADLVFDVPDRLAVAGEVDGAHGVTDGPPGGCRRWWW